MTEPDSLSAGKLRGLARLADRDGRFRMVAVDQRPPLFRALASALQVAEDELAWEEVADAKALLVRELGPHAGAVLLDPVWAQPRALLDLPGDVGMLSTLEGYAFREVDGERRSQPIEGWSVAKARRSGADAIKVLAWDRPDVSEATRRHQDAFVREAADACRRYDLPFVLELLDYPLPGEDVNDPVWIRAKAERVLGSLRHFADPSFGVDLFKLELPFDPHRVREVAPARWTACLASRFWIWTRLGRCWRRSTRRRRCRGCCSRPASARARSSSAWSWLSAPAPAASWPAALCGCRRSTPGPIGTRSRCRSAPGRCR